MQSRIHVFALVDPPFFRLGLEAWVRTTEDLVWVGAAESWRAALVRLADLLVDRTFADTVFFTNSGTETAELAIKMARRFHYENGQPERVEIVAFEGAFHGRSTGAIAAAGSEKMVKGFGPLMPGFTHLKWPSSDADHAAIPGHRFASR